MPDARVWPMLAAREAFRTRIAMHTQSGSRARGQRGVSMPRVHRWLAVFDESGARRTSDPFSFHGATPNPVFAGNQKRVQCELNAETLQTRNSFFNLVISSSVCLFFFSLAARSTRLSLSLCHPRVTTLSACPSCPQAWAAQ